MQLNETTFANAVVDLSRPAFIDYATTALLCHLGAQ